MDIRTIHPDELDAFLALNAYAFAWDEPMLERLRGMVPSHEVRAMFVDDQMAGGVWATPLSIWMNGREVPMTGLSAVAVAPERRGQGVVRALLTDMLREMKAASQCTSTLYPSSYALYRKFGWDLGAEDREYTFKPSDLAAALESAGAGPIGGTVRRCSLDDVDRLDQVYRAYASSHNGWVVRRPDWWERSVLRRLQGTHAFLWENSAGEPRGYLIYRLSGDMLKQKLTIREWVALDLDAWRALAAFMARHNTVATIWWTAPADDPLLTTLADPRIDESRILPRHMFRLVDVAAALSQRPYPTQVRAALRLQVQDVTAPWNHGSILLQVEGGEGRVLTDENALMQGRSAAGELSCDIQTLSQLYCGYLSPRQAWQLGRLTVDRQATLDALEEAFAIDKPHMSDYF